MPGGWFPAPTSIWPTLVAYIQAEGRPFTEDEIVADLRWWVDSVCAPGSTVRFPGRRALAPRWGVGDWTVRSMLRRTDLWLLPAKAETFTALARPPVCQPTTNPPPTHLPTHSERPDADSFREDQPTNQPASLHTRVVDQNPEDRMVLQEEDHDPSQETLSREGGTWAEEVSVSPTPSQASGSDDPVRASDPGSEGIGESEPECREEQTPPAPPPGELVMLPAAPRVAAPVEEVVAHWHGKVRAYGPRAGRAWHPRRQPTPREKDLLRKFIGTYGKQAAIDLIDAYHDGPPGRRHRHNDRGEEYVGIETLFKPTNLGDRMDRTAAWVEAGRPIDTEETASNGTAARSEPRPEPAWKLEKARRDLATRTFEKLAERIGQTGGAWRPPHFDELEEDRQWNAAAMWAGINAVGVHCGDGPRGGLGAILRTKRRDEWDIRRVFIEAFVAYDGDAVHQTEAVYVQSESGGMAFGGDR